MIVEITLVYLTLSFIITLISRLLVNPDDVRKVKEEIKFYQEKLKKAQKAMDKAKIKEYSNEFFKATQKQFRFMMKPLLITLLIIGFAFFFWLPNRYGQFLINLPFSLPFFGLQLNWLWWYILISIPTTIIFRKLLGVE